MKLSPLWLNLSKLLSKISIVGWMKDSSVEVADPSKAEQANLTSGTAGMRHITLKDELSNFFVLKRSKQEKSGNLLDIADSD